MRTMMNRTGILLFITLALFGLTGWLLAGTEFTLVEKPTEDQAKSIRSLLDQIKKESEQISTYYKDLKERDKINDKNQTLFPLRAELERNPGNPARGVLNVSAMINWSGEKPVQVVFHQRRGMVKLSYLQKRQIIFTPVEGKEPIDPANIPLEIFVIESYDSDFADYMKYLFPKGEEPVRDEIQKFQYLGIEQKLQVIYIRDVETRLETLRETRDLFKLLTRRLDWYIREDSRRRTMNLRNTFER